jgi:uncharacterized protein
MNRETIIEKLRAHQPELNAAGILSLRLFGSVARGEARPDSDVDLIARFAKGLSLIDVAEIECALTDLLGAKVDLAQEEMLKEPIRLEAEHEAVLAF